MHVYIRTFAANPKFERFMLGQGMNVLKVNDSQFEIKRKKNTVALIKVTDDGDTVILIVSKSPSVERAIRDWMNLYNIEAHNVSIMVLDSALESSFLTIFK